MLYRWSSGRREWERDTRERRRGAPPPLFIGEREISP
jgi:hypothetical protein